VIRSNQLWQDPIQQLELPTRPDQILIDLVGRHEVLLDLGKDIRVIGDLSELHIRILQCRLVALFPACQQSLFQFGTPKLLLQLSFCNK
jgi:hypothetical protein